MQSVQTILYKNSIVTSFDENYMEYAKVMVKTLSENYNGLDRLSLYCLVPDYLIDKEKEFVSSLDVTNLNISFKCSEKLKDLDVYNSGWFTKNAWHRLFLASVLPEEQRIVYIDPDCMVLRDISPLLNYPMYSSFVACPQDDFSKHCEVSFGSPDIPYINDGVFITDLNFWRENDMESKMLSYLSKNGQTEFVDQDIISISMLPFISPLPVTFNFIVARLELYNNTPSPMIVHFNGPEKPWKFNIENIYHDAWKEKFKSLTYHR